MPVPALTRETGLARRTVFNASQQLMEAGLIAIEKGTGGKPNKYRILAVRSSDPVPLAKSGVEPSNSAIGGAPIRESDGTPRSTSSSVVVTPPTGLCVQQAAVTQSCAESDAEIAELAAEGYRALSPAEFAELKALPGVRDLKLALKRVKAVGGVDRTCPPGFFLRVVYEHEPRN